MTKVRDIAYVRFAAPDLALGRKFLADFGFTLAGEEAHRLYFRCAGENHYAYVLEEGEPAFLGLAFEAGSHADLEAFSQLPGASAVEPITAPGGGHRVALKDPDGFGIEIVYGQAKLEPIEMRAPLPINFAHVKQRTNTTVRPAVGAAQMRRLGHVGLEVTDLQATIDWYGKHLGMIASDVVRAGPHSILAFVRCGYPGVYSDHHSLALFQADAAGFGHVAFEVQDFDAVGLGHYHLKRAEWQHAWGIGRHTLGSQIFDYWLDPWGRMIEHFADGDLFDETIPTNYHAVEDTPIEIWGPPMPTGKGPQRERVTDGTL